MEKDKFLSERTGIIFFFLVFIEYPHTAGAEARCVAWLFAVFISKAACWIRKNSFSWIMLTLLFSHLQINSGNEECEKPFVFFKLFVSMIVNTKCAGPFFFSFSPLNPHTFHTSRVVKHMLSLCLRDPGALGGRVWKPLCLSGGH